MGSSSNHSLPSKSQIENHNKLNNDNINSETVGKPSFSQNIQNNNIQDMAPPPVKQDLDNHPLDEFLNDSTTPSRRNNENINSKIINNPTQKNKNDSKPLPQIIQQNPNIINNNIQPQMQIGVARPYVQPVGVPVGIPAQNYPYQGPYYLPGQPIYPIPYYRPQPPINSIVLPPGYKPDYGYSPYGNISEDLNNLF